MSSIFNFFPQEVVSSIGWTLLHSLWQGGIAALLLYFALYYLRNKNADIKAFISTTAMAVVLIAAVVTFAVKYNAAVSSDVSGSTIVLTADEIAALNSGDLQNKTADAGILSIVYEKFIHYFNENVSLIVTLWMAGFFFFTLRFTGGVILTSRMRKKIVLIDDGTLKTGLDNLCSKLNIKKRIIFAESALVKVPIVLGYLKPMILLPFGLASGLPQDQIEAIIAHEIAHIKRYDILINIFQSIAEIIFFYNPFVWYISYKIRAERENACDDIAIELCGNSIVYAKALANAESFKKSNEPLFAIPLFKNQNQLVRRIKRMLHKDQNQNGFKEKFAAALIFIGILVTAAVLKNVNAGVNTDAQMNKAGIMFPSSLFVGGKELSNIEIDTTKASHNKRSFSYLQKEDGKMKRYKAKMKDGELTSLSIDGEKVPQEKLSSYKSDVEEAYKKIESEGYYFGPGSRFRFEGDLFDSKLFNDSMKEFSKGISKWATELSKNIANSFDSKEFRENMKQMEKEIQNSVGKWHESDEFKNSMKEFQKQMKANSGKWKEHFNSDEYKKSIEKAKKEIEKLKQELKNKDYYHNGKFDEDAFEKKMDKINEELEKKLEKLSESENYDHFASLGALKGLENLKCLESLKGLDSLKTLGHMKSLEKFKNHDFAMKGFNKSMNDFGIKMKDFGAKMKVFGKFMQDVKEILVEEKVIDDTDDDINLNIKKDGVYVDGEKQSDKVFSRVKELYKKYYNKEFDGHFDLNIK